MILCNWWMACGPQLASSLDWLLVNNRAPSVTLHFTWVRFLFFFFNSICSIVADSYRISRMWPFLSFCAASIIVWGKIISHSDYCHSLLTDLPASRFPSVCSAQKPEWSRSYLSWIMALSGSPFHSEQKPESLLWPVRPSSGHFPSLPPYFICFCSSS